MVILMVKPYPVFRMRFFISGSSPPYHDTAFYGRSNMHNVWFHTYNIWFDVCAVCVLAVLLLAIHIKNNVPIAQNRVFALLTVLTLLSTVTDLVSTILNNIYIASGAAPITLAWISNLLYFVSRNTTTFVYAVYIIKVLNLDWKSVKQLAMLIIPYILALLLIVLSPFFHGAFYIDKTGLYHRGPLISILYLIAAYYMGLVVLLTLGYRSFIPAARRMAFHSFTLITLVTVCIQGAYPTQPVECFGTTICILLIYLTIQRPEELLDGPSGLMNRQAFLTVLSLKFRQRARFELLAVTITQAGSLEKSLSMGMMSDLTNAIGTWMRQNMKKATLYHTAEGQFCILSKHYDTAHMEKTAALLAERFSQPWKLDGLHIRLPVCYLRIRCPEDAASKEQIIDMLEAVSESAPQKDSSLLLPADLDMEGRRRSHEIKQIIGQALVNNWLEVYYQPIYSVAEKRFTSAEALLRLRHPSLGFIPPDEFIPIAEDTGIIVPIGQFVLNSVCRCLSQRRLSGFGIKYIEVNLSVVECLQNDLSETVLRTLRRYRVLPSQINFEITETAMCTMPNTLMSNINKLASVGIRFSLDDYGTGYSNLTRLLEMPLDIIKIDKSLIQTLFQESAHGADVVIDSTFRMLRSLNRQTLAEGVETAEQAGHIISMGCDYIQGYYYAKPMPEADFVSFLAQVNTSQPSVG